MKISPFLQNEYEDRSTLAKEGGITADLETLHPPELDSG